MSPPAPSPALKTSPRTRTRPRLGFLGVGWIGQHRLKSIARCGAVEVAAVADPSEEAAARAAGVVQQGQPRVCRSLEDLLSLGLDGVVIATPSAMHARQAIQALEAGAAVFCQKPLGRNAAEVRAVVEAARRSGRLLGVDLSYRHLRGLPELRSVISGGGLGQVFAADLTFHNAYGPDKAWFYDPAQSGGGCVIDLGIHLVDLLLWMLPGAEMMDLRSRLSSSGQPVLRGGTVVEDHASVQMDLRTLHGWVTATLACSWRLHAGQDAAISAAFHGTRGGAALRNVNGSFYDFTVERTRGTSREVISSPPDDWGGRAAVAWAQALERGAGFDAQEGERLVEVAAVLDRIYSP